MSSGEVEIRRDEKGGIDEIVGHGVIAHMERLGNGSWFLVMTRPDQTQEAFWLNGKGRVEFTSHEHRAAPEIGPNAAPWSVDRYDAGILEGLRIGAEVAEAQAKALWERGETKRTDPPSLNEQLDAAQAHALGHVASAIEARAKEMGLAKRE